MHIQEVLAVDEAVIQFLTTIILIMYQSIVQVL